ncbi:Hypothetical protein, putative [Bodo saltans]|uniref:Uncharacterized protein n=1 Tax=Bodo saltans TaxID=75058 RepID=A0A0S4JUL9_BODSA|nr:Hypothetical protein, putative [Bodo saltans]|eukprot:CUG93912.1 Hypothetical protein, putative [Bodo saltans]
MTSASLQRHHSTRDDQGHRGAVADDTAPLPDTLYPTTTASVNGTAPSPPRVATNNTQLSKLEEIRAKYGERLAVQKHQDASVRNGDLQRQNLSQSRDAVQAMLLSRRGGPDDPHVVRQQQHQQNYHGSAREQIEAMLSNPKRLQSSTSLELSFHRCVEAAAEAAEAAPFHEGEAARSPKSNAAGRTTRKQAETQVASLVQTLRQRRDASETAALAAMQDLSNLLEASHQEEAHALSVSFLRKSMAATHDDGVVGDYSQHNWSPITHNANHITTDINNDSRNRSSYGAPLPEEGSTAVRGIQSPPTTTDALRASNLFGSKGSTPLTIIASVPHLLQHGLFFSSLDLVTHTSGSSASSSGLPTATPRSFCVAASVEELMTYTARQLALRILFAVWRDIMVPMGSQLAAYEDNYSLSQVSTAAVRATLYRWGATTTAAAAVTDGLGSVTKKKDFLTPHRSGNVMFEDSQGFDRVAELFDSGMLQVVVSRESMNASSNAAALSTTSTTTTQQQSTSSQAQHTPPLPPSFNEDGIETQQTSFVSTDASLLTENENVSVRRDGNGGGVILRHEAPLAGTSLFRRWSTSVRETFRREENLLRYKVRSGPNELSATSLQEEADSAGIVVVPRLLFYVFEMRPGTLDGIHFLKQFSELL